MPLTFGDALALMTGDPAPAAAADVGDRALTLPRGQDATWETSGNSPAGSPQAGVYSGDNTSIDNGVDARVLVDVFDGGDNLLDIDSDPLNPTVLADGYYLVSVWVNSFPLTANGYFTAGVILDVDQGIAQIDADSRPDANSSGPSVCVSAGSFIPAGGRINVWVENNDGESTRNFSVKSLTIVKLG